jgi:hypothetical protein
MADSSRRLRIQAPPAGSNPPQGVLDLRTRLRLVEELRERTGIERLFQPPRDWAELAGFEVALTLALTADELADDRTVFYVWHRDERERGIRVHCGLSRTFLRSAKIEHTWPDVWRFALDLAVPIEARRNGLERLSRAQPHCPVDVMRDFLAGRW